MNTLYYGDNLKKQRDFLSEPGAEAESQIRAFEDKWPWHLAAEAGYIELINEPFPVGRMIESFRQGNF